MLNVKIRRLLQDRNNLDKELSRTQQQLARVEGNLQNAVKGKSALTTQMACMEKDLKDMQKATDVLKHKVRGGQQFGCMALLVTHGTRVVATPAARQ